MKWPTQYRASQIMCREGATEGGRSGERELGKRGCRKVREADWEVQPKQDVGKKQQTTAQERKSSQETPCFPKDK